MKKISTFWGLFLMASILMAQAGEKSAIADRSTYLNDIKEQLQLKWPKNRTINLVFHGHSVPAGYFVTPNVNTLEAYPQLSLKKVKKAYPWAVVNSITTAIGGENSVAGAKRFTTEVLSHRPDVVFIDYGLNDRRAGLEAAKAAWEQMIQEALAKKVKVILLTPTPDQREDLLAPDSELTKHAKQIRALAAQYQVGLVDSYQLFQELAKKENLKDYMAQSNHVNALGHDVVANGIKTWFGITNKKQPVIYPPYVNQLGYNLGESKRFVCYGAQDNTPFKIINTSDSKVVYEGRMLNQEGWFTPFNPVSGGDEYVIEVEGHGRSVPFWIADHLLEKAASKLAYDFFVDARGGEDLATYDMSKVYGGGPTRDVGAYGLETVFEVLQYASNPALYDRWTKEVGEEKVADLIDLILWHAEFAYQHIAYNGPVANRHGSLGYEGEPRMSYDYWNTLDHLAAVCGAYHSFLKPYLSEEKYQQYRHACLANWEKYDRHKVVRYWTYSTKWVDLGFQEFNEMGNVFGQSVFSNLFMYLCEKEEADGQPAKFLHWAQESAADIIANWDFNNPRHMWWIRNAEHITPQALAYFLMVLPEEAPKGTRQKLAAWAIHMKQKTNNFWKYRKHSETEWAHTRTKELGGAPALAGSMFAIAHLLEDEALRKIGWAQVDFVFGVNPVGTHLSNKSEERVKAGAYWEGVEEGWPQSHPDGYGQLGLVRGTLDGSPLDSQFPIAERVEKVEGQNEGKAFGKNAYATEGWGVTNRGWMATLTFSTLGSQSMKIFDAGHKKELNRVGVGQTIIIELKAALNQDWKAIEEAWVELRSGEGAAEKLKLRETGVNTGIFTAKYQIPENTTSVSASYGYLGFEKVAVVKVN